ncbi:MAG TPA: hypothetical protein VFN48_11445 [Solirubrobacteraceae bacterium]|nr:hypothetical protein [Solirubrobacteraceae bacterium]
MIHPRTSAVAGSVIAACAIAAVNAAPAAAHAPVRTHTLTLTGTVASTDPAAHDFTLDTRSGNYVIHIGRLPVTGETITVKVHKDHKGMFETNSFKVDKHVGKKAAKGHGKHHGKGKAKGHATT